MKKNDVPFQRSHVSLDNMYVYPESQNDLYFNVSYNCRFFVTRVSFFATRRSVTERWRPEGPSSEGRGRGRRGQPAAKTSLDSPRPHTPRDSGGTGTGKAAADVVADGLSYVASSSFGVQLGYVSSSFGFGSKVYGLVWYGRPGRLLWLNEKKRRKTSRKQLARPQRWVGTAADFWRRELAGGWMGRERGKERGREPPCHPDPA